MVRSLTQLTRMPLRLQHRVLCSSPPPPRPAEAAMSTTAAATQGCVYGSYKQTRAAPCPHGRQQAWAKNLPSGASHGKGLLSLRGFALERNSHRLQCAIKSACFTSGPHPRPGGVGAAVQALFHSASPSGSPPAVIPEEPEGDELSEQMTMTEGDRGVGDPSVAPPSSPMEGQMLKALEKALGCKLGHGPIIPEARPLVIVISGPSGVGKDAVIKRLQEKKGELHFVVTATTRPRRPGEVDGQDYFFVSHDEFRSMIAANELLEHAVVYGDYKGIPKQQVRDCMARGMDVVVRVDVQGAATLRTMLGQDAVFIFLVAESEVALVRRLVERKTESMEKILVRVATARDETLRVKEFDYVVVNRHGQIDQTVDAIRAIIDAEKARVVQKNAKL